jgi:hypothetical protein
MSRACQQAASSFPRKRSLRCFCALLTAVLGPSVSRPALAAPDDVVQADPEPANGKIQFALPAFDQIAFPGFVSGAAARTQIMTRMRLYIEELDAACDLTDEQMTKLQLAAAGDIKRLFDATDTFRERYRAAQDDQDALRTVWREIQAHTSKVDQVLFGDSSMFSKTMRNVLTDEQRARYAVVHGERNRSYYKATVEGYLVALEDVVPLSAAQHDALVKLLVEETAVPLVPSAHGFLYVRYQLATLSDERLSRFLDDRQRMLLEQQLFHAHDLKPFLVLQGLLPSEDPAPDADSAESLHQAEQ